MLQQKNFFETGKVKKPFLLLDRDGTVIVERNYLSRPDQVELIPGAAQALHMLREMGWGMALITNQSGIGRGYFSVTDVEKVHRCLQSLLAEKKAWFDGIYFCPHHPEYSCQCRKPAPGLVYQAAFEHGFDPRQCLVVGDKVCDLELGRGVGARTILVRTGYGRKIENASASLANLVIDDLSELPDLIRDWEKEVRKN
jgi:D-glycero-D-manno-heptose 1,7-bisphosphate phosphatase